MKNSEDVDVDGVVSWDVAGGARAEVDESQEGRCVEDKGERVGDRAPNEGAFESNVVKADASERVPFFMLLVCYSVPWLYPSELLSWIQRMTV